jgi:Bacterial Ig-like domain (group 2)
MVVVRLALVLTLGALATGCDGKSNPATPSPRAPATVTGLAISGIDAVLTDVSTSYTATATLFDGTTRAVTPTWTSSNTDMATVDNVGRLDARAHGATTLTATHDGISATKSVQVVNNYRGTWVGRFVVTACDAPPGVCHAREVDIFSFPLCLEVSQTGDDLSDLSAVLFLPSYFQIRANISGRVSSDGRLNLAGSSEVDRRGSIWATFHVGAWDTTLSGRDTMTGRWAQRLSNLQPPYNDYMENELETMTRRASTTDGTCLKTQ